MAPAESAILAIPITNHEAKDLPETVLADVSFTSSGGMKMVMTEGSQVYSTDLSRKAITGLVKNSTADWTDTFKSLLLRAGADDTREIVAVAHSDHMTIIVRERGDIPLKLCSFEVHTSETAEVSLYDWTVKAVQALQQERKGHSDVAERVKKDETALQEAEEQLQTLQETSRTHEKELLSKFCQLLNSKKDKIRELQSRPASKGKDADNGSKRARHKSPVAEDEDDEDEDRDDRKIDDDASMNSGNERPESANGNDDENLDEAEAQSSAGSSQEEDNASDTGDEDEEL